MPEASIHDASDREYKSLRNVALPVRAYIDTHKGLHVQAYYTEDKHGIRLAVNFYFDGVGCVEIAEATYQNGKWKVELNRDAEGELA